MLGVLRTWAASLRLGCLVTICLAARSGLAQVDLAARFADRASFDQFVAEGRESPFGLDYVFVHSPGARDQELVDQFCAAVGIRWVNFARLEWKLIEPKAPVAGRHTYNWRDLDRAVRTWQRNGIHIMVSMRFESPWATAERTDDEFVYLKGIAKAIALAGADYLPKPEHREDLRDYMAAVVERYDGDGVDDMPGLLFPVLHYQIGNEYYNEVFWAGSAEQYGELLKDTATAARSACSEVQIILSGIGFEEVYGFYRKRMSPRTKSYVDYYLAKVPENMKPFVERSGRFSAQTVRLTEFYDVLDARWPNYGIVAASREMLSRTGATDRQVWSAEIYSGFPLMEPLVLPNWTLQALPTPSKSREYLKILKNKNHSQFDEVNGWYRGMQAAQVVKICMAALSAGSEKLMMGWAVDAQNPLAVSTLSHHGLYSITFRRLWPAATTYDLLIRKLSGVQRVQLMNDSDSVYVYRCDCEGGRTVLVAFCDDHIGQNHDQPSATLTGAIRTPWPRVRVTEIVTQVGQTQPETQIRDVAGGRLRLTLTEYPVFIESADNANAAVTVE